MMLVLLRSGTPVRSEVMRLVVLLAVGMAWAADQQPAPVPSMYPDAWVWSALYGNDDGTAVVLAMAPATGTRVDLGIGRRPVPATVTLAADGRLSDGLQIQDHARRIAQPALPLLARWVRATRSTGFNSVSVTTPIPERFDDPRRPILMEHQARLVADALAWMEPQDDKPQHAVAEEPLPPFTRRFTDDTLTEVTWWSADLVSTLDWRVYYSGGAHANTTLTSHTWRRDASGTWRLITLDDLLGPAVTWKAAAQQAVVADLVRQQAGWYDGDSVTFRPADDLLLRVWSVAGDALVISFPPYEVGPFSQGVFQVRIPWKTVGRDHP